VATSLPSVTHSKTRLAGRLRTISRLVVGAMVALTLAAFVPMLPSYMRALHQVCGEPSCPSGQLTIAGAHALASMGVSISAYATYTVVISLLSLAATGDTPK
jgi:hypothetical protein